MKLRVSYFTLIIVVVALTACGSYKQNIMFAVPEGTELQQQIESVEKNYVIQKNDQLKLSVYTNKGELIIDPDYNLLKEIPGQSVQRKADPYYLIDVIGVAKFPMIGELNVEGLTIRQAEAILQKEYSKYYTDPFVILTYSNKRVVVLGAMGGHVIPLVNDNVTLVEVLALATGLNNDSKANNIRVLRGEQFFVADLSTIEGYRRTNMIMQPGDIVYVEPIRRPFSESARDYLPVVSLLTSLTTLIVVLINL